MISQQPHTTALRIPAPTIAMQLAASLCIGMLVGIEREWANKEFGPRSFAFISVLGMFRAHLPVALGWGGVRRCAPVDRVVGRAKSARAETDGADHVDRGRGQRQLQPCLAGTGLVLASIAGALINLPIVARGAKNSELTRRLVTLTVLGIVVLVLRE
jgi:hypothetical protein